MNPRRGCNPCQKVFQKRTGPLYFMRICASSDESGFCNALSVGAFRSGGTEGTHNRGRPKCPARLTAFRDRAMDSSQMNGKPEGTGNDEEAPHTPILESVSRLSKIPMVEKTLTAATDVYEKFKESSSALNWTLSTAESTVNKAVESAMPLTAKLEKPLKRVDSLLCSSLDYVESKVPAVKLPPQEILDSTKTLVVEKATAVKEYSGQKLRRLSMDRQSAALLAQNCKELASTGMEKAKNAAHRLISPKEETVVDDEESKKGKQQQPNSVPGEAEAVPSAAMQYEGDDAKTPPYVLRY